MGSAGHTIFKMLSTGISAVTSLFMAITALGRTLAHLFMAALAGFVSPILAHLCNLATLGSLMTGGTSFFQFGCHMFFVWKTDIAIFGGEVDCVTT
jgi:hypothetical protein